MKKVKETFQKIFRRRIADRREAVIPREDNAPRALLFRLPVKTSSYYYQRARKLDTILLVSSVLDLLIFSLLDRSLPPHIGEVSLATAIFLLVLSLTDSWKEPILSAVAVVKDKRRTVLGIEKKHYWISLAVFTLVFTATFASKFKLENFSFALVLQIAFCLFIAFVSAVTMLRQIRAVREKHQSVRYDLATQIEQANQVNFILVAIELCAARLVGPLLCIASIEAYPEFSRESLGAVSFVLTLLLLASQTPKQATFQVPCNRCRKLTSKVALGGLCIECHYGKMP